jgi:hypothetical protein
MPNYSGAAGSATALSPGDQVNLLAAEAPVAGQASMAVAPMVTPGGDYAPIAFDIEYSANPNADTLAIQGAMTDTDAAYQTFYTSPGTNASSDKLHDFYSDLGKFTYYRVKQIARAGNQTQTVTVRR